MTTERTWHRWVHHSITCTEGCQGADECGGCQCHTEEE